MFENLCLASRDKVRKVGLMETVIKGMEETCFFEIIDAFTDQSIVFNDTPVEEEEELEGSEDESEDEWETDDGEEEVGEEEAIVEVPHAPAALAPQDAKDGFFSTLA